MAARLAATPVPGAEALDFRDIDASTRIASVLSIGPGDASRIYRTEDGGATWTLQFTNDDPKIFLDAMAFSDAAHGVAFSDSVDGQFVILLTSDGGGTGRASRGCLPAALPGEGAFAASGTNVACTATHIWIGTTASRVLHSADAGRTWTVTTTPVATGEATGIFSIAFRDDATAWSSAGITRRRRDAIANVATTDDGGATWGGARGERRTLAHRPTDGQRRTPGGGDRCPGTARLWRGCGDSGRRDGWRWARRARTSPSTTAAPGRPRAAMATTR